MKFIYMTLVVSLPLLAISQKQGNVWLFGTQSGLNFNSGSPVASGGQTGTNVGAGENQEGTACISDSSGALLFYANGNDIWNKNGQVMQNGNDINGGISSTQAALIVPKPGSDSLFYVFTSDEFQSYTSPPLKGYRYSIVNMCLDNGNGGVIPGQKNILLLDSATEKLSACLDAAGTGYWVMGHKMFTKQFHAWHLTASGITSTVVSTIGTLHGWYPTQATWSGSAAQGQMKFNPAGTKLALVIGNFQPAVLDLFDFNNSTGLLSNACHMAMDSVLAKSAYGLEFSPDGSKVFATLSGGAGNNKVVQFDLNAGSCTAVRSSSTVVYQTTGPGIGFTGMQIATDNKIYVVFGADVSAINLPNAIGAACNYSPAVFSAPVINNTYTFPSFVAGFAYTNNLVLCRQIAAITASTSSNLLCAGEPATLTASGASTYSWNTGAASSSIVVTPTTTTTYTVTGFANGMTGISTVITQSVAACTALKQTFTDGTYLRVFPNPGQGLVNVQSSAIMELVEVLDQYGTCIYQSRPGELSTSFKLQAAGLFIIRVRCKGQTLTQKLVVNGE